MRWKITIEGLDEFGGRDTAEMVIEKQFNRLSKGEIGLSISDGKSIMACLQQLVVKQQCEAYGAPRRRASAPVSRRSRWGRVIAVDAASALVMLLPRFSRGRFAP